MYIGQGLSIEAYETHQWRAFRYAYQIQKATVCNQYLMVRLQKPFALAWRLLAVERYSASVRVWQR